MRLICGRDVVGAWAVRKWRRAAKVRGVPAVGRQLRKQGIPLWVALRVPALPLG